MEPSPIAIPSPQFLGPRRGSSRVFRASHDRRSFSLAAAHEFHFFPSLLSGKIFLSWNKENGVNCSPGTVSSSMSILDSHSTPSLYMPTRLPIAAVQHRCAFSHVLFLPQISKAELLVCNCGVTGEWRTTGSPCGEIQHMYFVHRVV